MGKPPGRRKERKDPAEYLYGERKWSQARIAEALNVSQRTVSNDLATVANSTKRGRPRKEPANRKSTPELDTEISELVEKGEPVGEQAARQAAPSGHGSGP